ncbi:hypothetical protein LAZ67_10000094 [Cordylochernes scorpioides]|uniref:Paraneoplastic antigen Ma-like C-terminal domain-containing protein n=1 Tax=Cordylochernes scorpioides TaxID=51811 RepID=A0ABY6KUT1_9ARAC|nr:hypothetical protein LAZ67_10000094 [Cordylochernes scorpioides]
MASEELLKQFMSLWRQERKKEEEREQEREEKLRREREERERRREQEEEEKLRRREEREEKLRREKEEKERRREQEREEKLRRREEKEEKLKREKEEKERRREQEREEKLKRREEEEGRWAKMLSGIGVELKGELAALDSKMGEINIALESEVDEKKGEFKRLEDEPARLKSNGGFVAGTASAVLKLTPPTFDGQSSFGSYMRQFEAVSLNNGWGEAERAINLIVALRGPALDLLQTVPEQDQRSYVSLVSALELRFGDQHSRHVFQSQLKLRRQKMGESLQEFEADLKRLCLMAYPGAPIDLIDQWVARTFIEGIRNVEVQKTLRLTSFNTSREALIRALEIDAAFEISDSGPPRVRKSELTEEDGAVGGSRDSGIGTATKGYESVNNSRVEQGTDLRVEEELDAEQGTDLRVEEKLDVKKGTDLKAEEKLDTEQGTDLKAEEKLDAEQGTDLRVEEKLDVEKGTDLKAEEKLDTEQGTDLKAEEKLDAEQGTDLRVEENLDAEQGTESKVEGEIVDPKDWLKEGLVDRVDEIPPEGKGYWFPDRLVFGRESETTPIRPVFDDASCRGNCGLALRRYLRRRPGLQRRIPEIRIELRKNKFGVLANLKRYFRMMAIKNNAWDYLRFLWKKKMDNDGMVERFGSKTKGRPFEPVGTLPGRAIRVDLIGTIRVVSSYGRCEKKSGQIRICLDPRKLNEALVGRHFQTPAPAELLHEIPKSKYFTVLDVKSAYWHIPVAKECRDLLVMTTPFG